MKVLFISSVYYPDVFGGGEISTKFAAESLVKKGIEVDVLCCGNAKIEHINGVRIDRREGDAFLIYKGMLLNKEYWLSKYKRLYLKYIDYYYDKKTYERYKKYFREGNYDVIQTNSPVANMGRYNIWKAAHDLGIPISHVFRCPALVTNHNNKLLDNILKRRNSIALKNVDCFAGPSNYILKYNSVLDKRIAWGTVIPNAVEDIEKKEIVKSRTIVYAGTINEDKGIYTLVNAYELLNEKPNILFVGKGELRNFLVDRGYKVIDWLPRKELYEIIAQAWLLVLPSEWPEAFGRVIIEAVSNCTIPIASKIAGIPEILDVYPDLMFEPGNEKQLANKLNKYLSINQEKYKNIIELLSKEFVKYSISNCEDNWARYMDWIKNNVR
ncbi:MAG: glycosyltransferase [Lachnospiraceae bacterium]|nr:glycosyltransferase [Lachnospiraceae bacterium]